MFKKDKRLTIICQNGIFGRSFDQKLRKAADLSRLEVVPVRYGVRRLGDVGLDVDTDARIHLCRKNLF